MILGDATGVGGPDPVLEALIYGGEIGSVVLGGTGPGWLWEGEGGIFEFYEEMNMS